jgi:NADH dehydrogenase (ubiquinone) 1 alpha subcomplex subunit 9
LQIIVPYRGDHYNALRLRVVGDLGQVLFSPFHLRDEESIRKAITHSNVVFNLIGREFESRNFTFDDVHVHGARRLAKLAREAGVKRFIHVSHVNAAEHPEVRFSSKNSLYLKHRRL